MLKRNTHGLGTVFLLHTVGLYLIESSRIKTGYLKSSAAASGDKARK
jgi:hypothetical protein